MMTSTQAMDNNNPDTAVIPEPAPATAQPGVHPELEAYWVERKRYLQKISTIPELRRRYFKAALAYLLRRLLWSFGFFPLILAFWVPLVVSRFNPVAMVQDVLPRLESFVAASPQVQANTLETLGIIWLSVGFIIAVFDFVLTPFKSPYDYEADVHMRAWEQMQIRLQRHHEALRQTTVAAPQSEALTPS